MSSTDFQVRSAGPGSALGAADDRPLTDQEQQMLTRLLSDPFSFPLAFKAWLVSYLETSDMSLPMSSVLNLTSTLGISGAGQGTLGIFPAGIILPYGGVTAPTGALLCDGAAYPTSTQARLFAAIGYSYGGSGSTFNVPDLQGRIPVGKGPHGDVDTPGKNEGVAVGARRPRHRTSELGWDDQGIAAGTDAAVILASAQTGEIGSHFHGPAGAPIDTPAYLVINFLIVA